MMQLLLIFAIFWPAAAGLGMYFLNGAKENRSLRGTIVVGALAVELAAVIALCTGVGTGVKLLEMTPTLSVEMNVDVVGCIFAVLMSAMWLIGSVFALYYMGHDENERLYQMYYMTVLSALVGQRASRFSNATSFAAKSSSMSSR